jgi:hypothetical protein
MDKHAQQPQIEVQDIDHLGIVAGIIDEIGLAEEIDRRVGTHPQEHVSSSQAVKAMILNAGFGFCLRSSLSVWGVLLGEGHRAPSRRGHQTRAPKRRLAGEGPGQTL